MDKNENLKNSIKEDLDTLFELFFLIVDYHEIKLNDFLITKKFKKYTLFVIFRFFFLVVIFFNYFYLPLFIFIIPLYCIFEYIFYNRFNYNKVIYRKTRKTLLDFRKNLILLLNNHIFVKIIEEESNKEMYKNKFNKINDKLNNYKDIFKPFKVIINQFQLITLFLVLLGFIIDFSYELIWYNKIIEWNVILGFMITFLYSFIVYYLLSRLILRDYYDKTSNKSLSIVETYLLKVFDRLNFRLESWGKTKLRETIKEIENVIKKWKSSENRTS